MSGFFYILTKLLKNFNYNLSEQKIKERLFSDPNGGIVSITNTLDYFNVKNLVANVPKEALSQLPNSFIGQVDNDHKTNLVLITKKDNKNVKINTGDKLSISVGIDDFLKNWTGLVIAIEKNKGLKKFRNNVSLHLKVGLSISLILLMIYIGFFTQSFLKVMYLAVSLLGLLMSYLIVGEKLGNNEPSRFCTISKNTDCKSVLNSKESKLFKFVDLSDASLVYFSFVTLSFVYEPNTTLYFVLSMLSLPIVGYSIYTQKYTIKKWCPLCLGIGFIVMLQLTIQAFMYKGFNFSYLTLVFLSFVLITTRTLCKRV